jgi:hypothetical protein
LSRLIAGYFGVALLVDLTFTGAAFCTHVCPVGQFNSLASTLSPGRSGRAHAGTLDAAETDRQFSARRW